MLRRLGAVPLGLRGVSRGPHGPGSPTARPGLRPFQGPFLCTEGPAQCAAHYGKIITLSYRIFCEIVIENATITSNIYDLFFNTLF